MIEEKFVRLFLAWKAGQLTQPSDIKSIIDVIEVKAHLRQHLQAMGVQTYQGISIPAIRSWTTAQVVPSSSGPWGNFTIPMPSTYKVGRLVGFADEPEGKPLNEGTMKRHKIKDVFSKLKVGMEVVTNGDSGGTTDKTLCGIVSQVRDSDFYIQISSGAMTGSNWHISKISDGWIEFAEEISKTTYIPGMPISEFVEKEIENEKEPERLKWLKTFQRCVLAPHIRETIEDALTIVLSTKFKDWGVDEHFEKGLTNSILLYGPPGCGKTMIGESIAAVLNKNLMIMASAELESQVPGQCERNIASAFQKAKDNNAVILFDECDSLLYNRDAVGMIIGAQINALLTEIERFDGVCILTTNRLGRLDPALQRRIVAKVKLEVPTKEARLQIWKNLIPPKVPVSDDIDYDFLSDHVLPGGDIKNVILLAIRRAISKNEDKLSHDHFKHAIRSVMRAKSDFKEEQPKPIYSSGNGHDKSDYVRGSA